ncbi:MAG: Coq4 family protein, partial [Pseudomonadota bacterium]
EAPIRPIILKGRDNRLKPLTAWRAMRKLLADKEDTKYAFDITSALAGRSLEKDFFKFLKSEAGTAAMLRGEELPDMLDDHAHLADLPDRSVGRAYLKFVTSENLSAEGLVAESRRSRLRAENEIEDDLTWYSRRLRDTHDLMHVLSGYGRDPLGEAAVLAFSYSQSGNAGLLFIAYMASLKINRALPFGGAFQTVREGLSNGKTARRIADQDMASLLGESLTSARERLYILRPSEYQRILSKNNGLAAHGTV